MDRAPAPPHAVPPEPPAPPSAPPAADHLVSPRPPDRAARPPPAPSAAPMRAVSGELRSSRLPTPLFPLRRSNSLGRGLSRRAVTQEPGAVESCRRTGEGQPTAATNCISGASAAAEERVARQPATKRHTLPVSLQALPSRLLPRGGSLSRLRPSNTLAAAAAAAVGTNRGVVSGAASSDTERHANASAPTPAVIGGTWASSLGHGPRRSSSPDQHQVAAGSARRVAPSTGGSSGAPPCGPSASTGRLRQPSPAASASSATAVHGSAAGACGRQGGCRFPSSPAVSAGSDGSRHSSHRSPRVAPGVGGYSSVTAAQGYGGPAVGATSGRPPPGPSSVTPCTAPMSAMPANPGTAASMLARGSASSGSVAGGISAAIAAASSAALPPLPRGRQGQLPSDEVAACTTAPCRAGSFRSVSSPAEGRSSEGRSLEPVSLDSRSPSISSTTKTHVVAEPTTTAPDGLGSAHDDVVFGSPVLKRPVLSETEQSSAPVHKEASQASLTGSTGTSGETSQAAPAGSGSTAATVLALKLPVGTATPITPLRLPLTADLEAPMPLCSTKEPGSTTIADDLSPDSSSGVGDCYNQTDQGSWGSASASKPCRTPPLSPLSMAQRHMLNRKPLGLRNLGNTCFLNAALQALAHAPLLAPFFLQGNFVRDLNAANPLGTGGVLATAFAGLLRSLYPGEEGSATGDGQNSTEDAFTPEEFYTAVCKVFPLLGEQRGAQQDAHEVLSFLLDALHEDLNRARDKPPYVERKDLAEADLSRKGEERYAAEAWHDHLRRHRSVLVDLCQGQLRSQVRCCECGTASVTFDPFLFLSLPLPSELKQGGNQPIEEAIRDFCKEERLDGADRWGCPRCERRVSALKRLSLWKLPLLLLVHLKRFGFEASTSWEAAPRAWKIEGEVTIPFSRLDLQSFVAETSPQRVPLQYDLFAAVDHVGATPLVGHYTAACRRADGWWRFDDSRAEFLGGCGESDEAVARDRVLGEGNYLLLFQRRDAPPEPELVREQSHKLPENWPHVKGPGVEWSFLPDVEASQQL